MKKHFSRGWELWCTIMVYWHNHSRHICLSGARSLDIPVQHTYRSRRPEEMVSLISSHAPVSEDKTVWIQHQVSWCT